VRLGAGDLADRIPRRAPTAVAIAAGLDDVKSRIERRFASVTAIQRWLGVRDCWGSSDPGASSVATRLPGVGREHGREGHDAYLEA
jgi:hypothetical protein